MQLKIINIFGVFPLHFCFNEKPTIQLKLILPTRPNIPFLSDYNPREQGFSYLNLLSLLFTFDTLTMPKKMDAFFVIICLPPELLPELGPLE